MRSKVTTLLFLAILFGLPLGQIGLELARGERPLCLEVGPAFVERRLPAFEEDLRKASFVRHELVPRYQHAVSWLFGRGNEKAIEGRDGWLFYADDLELVTGPGLFDPSRAGRRAVEVIAELRDALAERDIALCVVPVPVKGMVDARWLSFGGGETWPENPDTQAFYDALAAAGVDCVDLRAPWREWSARFPDGLFLERDTHWRPELMQLVAELVAERVEPALPPIEPDPTVEEAEPGAVEVTTEGDLVTMLRLPDGADVWPPMTFEVHPAPGALAAPSTGSDVLLLGDSFTKIFSDPALDSGERAGFAERLAVELGRPIDTIALVGGSATAVRETLARRAGGLDGKRLVIWEFGLRALAQSPDAWRSVPLPPPSPEAPGDDEGSTPGGTDAAGAARPAREGVCTLRAELLEASRVRDDFDYAFCLVIHRYRVLEVLAGDCADDEVWVAFVGMEDFVVQEPSSFAIGTVHRLVLEPLEEHWDLEEDTWWDVTNDGLGADPTVPFHYAVEWSEDG